MVERVLVNDEERRQLTELLGKTPQKSQEIKDLFFRMLEGTIDDVRRDKALQLLEMFRGRGGGLMCSILRELNLENERAEEFLKPAFSLEEAALSMMQTGHK